MPYNATFTATEPLRADVDMLPGPTVLEFGAPWCGYCVNAQPQIEAAFARHPHVRHIRIEDARGRPLGRSYKVKLWPTLVFLRDGQERSRLVRPARTEDIDRALAGIDPDRAVAAGAR